MRRLIRQIVAIVSWFVLFVALLAWTSVEDVLYALALFGALTITTITIWCLSSISRWLAQPDDEPEEIEP